MSASPNTLVGNQTTVSADCTAAKLIPVWGGNYSGTNYFTCQTLLRDGDQVPDPTYCWAGHDTAAAGLYAHACHVVSQPGDYASDATFCTNNGMTATASSFSGGFYGGYTSRYLCGAQGSSKALTTADAAVAGKLDTLHTDLQNGLGTSGTLHFDLLSNLGTASTLHHDLSDGLGTVGVLHSDLTDLKTGQTSQKAATNTASDVAHADASTAHDDSGAVLNAITMQPASSTSGMDTATGYAILAVLLVFAVLSLLLKSVGTIGRVFS